MVEGLRISEFMGKTYSFQIPKKILFGLEARKKVGVEAKALGGTEALLVTDKNLRKMRLLEGVGKSLSNEGFNVTVFDEVEAEPRLETAETVAKTVRGGRFDLIVGVGGGSVLDMAKVAAIAVTNPGLMRKYVGVNRVRKTGLPKVLLPTTAGTGSEVTNVAVVTLTENEMKSAIISPYMLGDVAIVDPTFTYTLPPRLTASTGLDALSHALEALMSVNASPITDSLALQSIRLIFTYLPEACRSGDSESRYGMSLASLIAGMSFGNAGVCLGHAAAYSFAVKYRVTHGVSCGLVLPYIFKFNASAITWKLPQIADAVGLETEELKKEELTSSITDAILGLMDKVDAPKKLREVGIPREALPKLADNLLSVKRLIKRNPKPISKREAFRLIEEMW